MTAVLFAVLALVVDTDLQFSLKLKIQKQLCTAYPFYLVERDKKHFIDYAVTSLIQFRAHQCSYTICGPSPSIRCLDPFVSILFPASAWGPLLVKWILYWQLLQFHYSDSRTSLIPFCAIILFTIKNDAPILCQFIWFQSNPETRIHSGAFQWGIMTFAVHGPKMDVLPKKVNLRWFAVPCISKNSWNGIKWLKGMGFRTKNLMSLCR